MSWIIWIIPALVIAAVWAFVRWGWYRVDAGKPPPPARRTEQDGGIPNDAITPDDPYMQRGI